MPAMSVRSSASGAVSGGVGPSNRPWSARMIAAASARSACVVQDVGRCDKFAGLERPAEQVRDGAGVEPVPQCCERLACLGRVSLGGPRQVVHSGFLDHAECVRRLRHITEFKQLTRVRCGVCKPSAQPTLVRTQHLPPRKTAGHRPFPQRGHRHFGSGAPHRRLTGMAARFRWSARRAESQADRNMGWRGEYAEKFPRT